ncbi:hypothetical protein ACJ72_02050 [Emergomyces africanus]|uniref:Uncharacterized protein n=1 Tax=Emergomyces africanus TaxID=1955775 RepID=A0A1B7P3H9_9EURO|nr:hypothetical protein ACJ72_02050 [Emergomyces africanus]
MASANFTGTVESRSDLLKIPILKFSYSTTSADRACPLGWTHLSSSGDLAVVFDHIMRHETSSAFYQGDQRLRVFRNGDVLELLNLNSLAREAAALPSHPFAQNVKPPVAIIVKSPCLAVRYPMTNDQTRRFQIKFPSNADYSTAISVFNKLGCSITHSSVAPSHQTSSNRPLSSSSQTPSLLQIGSGARTASPGLSTRPAGDYYQGRLCQSPLTEHSTSGSAISSLNNIPTSARSYYNPVNERPRTSALFVPSTGPPHNFASANSPTVTRPGPLSTVDARPATAPALPGVDTLSQILPPKRELPFSKPGTKPRSRQPSHFRGPASKLTRSAEPHGPSSFSISQAGASASNKANENLPPSSTNRDSSGIIANVGVNDSSTNPNPPFRLTLGRENLGANNPSTLQKLTGPTGIEPRASFANEAGNNHSEERNNVSNVVATTALDAAVSATPQLPPERSAGVGFISSTKHTNTANISPSDLSAYLSTRNPERTALVESWVCSQLENDAFLTLCQDVEGVWRRMAFGY